MSTWRDRIKVHPAADMFPMIPDAELDELAADIKENGLRNGVTLWTPEKWEDYWNKGNKWPKTVFLLDGRNRLEALQRAYSDDDPDEAIDAALSTNSRDLDLVGATLLWGDRTNPYAHVVSANLHRRHLNSEGRRNLITQLLKANPDRSDRVIAEMAKASPTTAGTIRHELEEAGEVSRLDTRTGKDGVAQPATKPSAVKPLPMGDVPLGITSDEMGVCIALINDTIKQALAAISGKLEEASPDNRATSLAAVVDCVAVFRELARELEAQLEAFGLAYH